MKNAHTVANTELKFKGKECYILNAVFLCVSLLDTLAIDIGWILNLEVCLE